MKWLFSVVFISFYINYNAQSQYSIKSDSINIQLTLKNGFIEIEIENNKKISIALDTNHFQERIIHPKADLNCSFYTNLMEVVANKNFDNFSFAILNSGDRIKLIRIISNKSFSLAFEYHLLDKPEILNINNRMTLNRFNSSII